MDSLRGESLTRIYDREGWEVDSSNPDGRIIRLTSLPAESLFHYSMYIMQHLQVWINKDRYITNHSFHTMQICRKFKSSSITKNVSLDIQKPLGGEAETTTQKSVPHLWRFNIKPTHESLHHRNQEGKNRGNHDSSDLLGCKKHRLSTVCRS